MDKSKLKIPMMDFASITYLPADILQAIEKREQNSVRSVLQKVGKSVLNTLLGVGITSATRAVVMPIIEKIMG